MDITEADLEDLIHHVETIQFRAETLGISYEEAIAQYGVKGMKWGVRKSRRGKIRARATMNRRDAKDSAWADKPVTEAFSTAYSRVYKKAAPKVRGAIRRINRDPRFKRQDFRKPSKLRDQYYSEISKAIADQLNAASTLVGQSPNKRYEMRFEYDITKTAKPEATIRHVDTKKGRQEQVVDAKKTRSFKHSLEGESDVIRFQVDIDDRGFITDFPEPSDILKQALVAFLDDPNSLAHYGVLGMKWGRRNAESRARVKRDKKAGRPTPKTPEKRDNTLRKNPKNRRMSDDELRAINKRLQLEREFAQLTYIPPTKKNESRVKSMLKDVAFDVTKGALTEVGKQILSKALRTQFNKVAAPDFRIDNKAAKDAADQFKKQLKALNM